jgi:hypothetical protein
MDGLQKDGAPFGQPLELFRALIGVAMKPGGKAPDLSSPDTFKASPRQRDPFRMSIPKPAASGVFRRLADEMALPSR